jgi:hypothetical protein
MNRPARPMPPPLPFHPVPPAPRRRRGVWVFLGVLVAVAGALIVAAWIFSRLYPRPVLRVTPDRFFTEDTALAIHLRDLRHDAGVRELLVHVYDLSQQMQHEQWERSGRPGGDWVAKMRQWQSASLSSSTAPWLPEVLVNVQHPPGAAESVFVVGVRLAGVHRFMVRIFLAVLGFTKSGAEEKYRGYKLTETTKGPAFMVSKSVVLFAIQSDLMRATIDRLAGEPAPGIWLAWAGDEDGGRWDFYGGSTRAGGVVTSLLSAAVGFVEDAPATNAPPPDTAWMQTVDRLRFGVDVITGDELESRIELQCVDEGAAGSVFGRAEELIQKLGVELKSENIRLVTRVDRQDVRVVVNLRLTGLRAGLSEILRHAEEKVEEVPAGAVTVPVAP